LIDYDREADDFRFEVRGTSVLYSQEVWHLDDWDPLVAFAKSIGAVKASYMSTEDIDDSDEGDMYFNKL